MESAARVDGDRIASLYHAIEPQLFPSAPPAGMTRVLMPRHKTSARPSQSASAASSSRDRVHRVRGRVRLEMHRMDEQSSGLAVRLQVEPRHKPVAEQEREDIIAVLALFGRGINLDPVVEVEEPQRAGALPDERIERRQQRARRDASRLAGVAVKIGEVSPPGNLDRLENARLDQRVDRLSRVVRTETEIVAQLLRRGDAERLGRALDEGAVRLTSRPGVGRARISAGMTRSVRS